MQKFQHGLRVMGRNESKNTTELCRRTLTRALPTLMYAASGLDILQHSLRMLSLRYHTQVNQQQHKVPIHYLITHQL